MRLLFIFLLASFWSFTLCAQSYSLTIKVNELKNTKGSIRVCLVNTSSFFLKDCQQTIVQPVERTSAVLQFDGLSAGEYAISLYHDENNNEELDTKGLFGIPTEPYGFSNNPRILFGPPSFEDCIVHLKSNQQIEIKLK